MITKQKMKFLSIKINALKLHISRLQCIPYESIKEKMNMVEDAIDR